MKDARACSRRWLGISGLCLFAFCILIPLAGRSGSAAPHALLNRLTLTGVLCAAWGTALAARRTRPGSASPLHRLAIWLPPLLLALLLTDRFAI